MSNAHDISYYRERTKLRAWEAVIKALEKANALHGTKRKDIADYLGVPPSQVSRWLSGPSNWGIETLSDLLLAAGTEMDFQPTRFKERPLSNEHHEINSTQIPASRKEASALEEAANPANCQDRSNINQSLLGTPWSERKNNESHNFPLGESASS
jgi:transcriptional regulator with XRE-family HTH domain